MTKSFGGERVTAGALEPGRVTSRPLRDKPINPNPHGANPTSPMSPDLRRQLENFPEQRARIRDVERRK